MCRNIRPLFNFDPPATEEEIRASALQYVRKISGCSRPSRHNQAVFDQAVDQVAEAARLLLRSLNTSAPPRDRESEKARAMAKTKKRFGDRQGGEGRPRMPSLTMDK